MTRLQANKTTSIPELHTSRFWLTPDGRLEVYSHRLASRLNKILKAYGGGEYTFADGEEALFRLTGGQVNQVLCVLSPRKQSAG